MFSLSSLSRGSLDFHTPDASFSSYMDHMPLMSNENKSWHTCHRTHENMNISRQYDLICPFSLLVLDRRQELILPLSQGATLERAADSFALLERWMEGMGRLRAGCKKWDVVPSLLLPPDYILLLPRHTVPAPKAPRNLWLVGAALIPVSPLGSKAIQQLLL